jgi:hypothetical protein
MDVILKNRQCFLTINFKKTEQNIGIICFN